MTPAATLGLYAGALVLVLVAAFGLGRAVGPVGAGAGDAPGHAPAHAPAHSAPVHAGDAAVRTPTTAGATR